jgi:hypothetical protein
MIQVVVQCYFGSELALLKEVPYPPVVKASERLVDVGTANRRSSEVGICRTTPAKLSESEWRDPRRPAGVEDSRAGLSMGLR